MGTHINGYDIRMGQIIQHGAAPLMFFLDGPYFLRPYLELLSINPWVQTVRLVPKPQLVYLGTLTWKL